MPIEPMRISYELTFADAYWLARRLLWLPSSQMKRSMVLSASPIILAFVHDLSTGLPPGTRQMILVIFLTVMVTLILTFGFGFVIANQIIDVARNNGRTQIIDFSEQKIELSTERSKMLYSWADLSGVRQYPNGLLFLRMGRPAFFVPRHATVGTGGWESFRRFIVERVELVGREER